MAHVLATLQPALQAAVPLWIEQWRDRPEADRIARAHELAPIIASQGDALLFKAKNTPKVFNALAEGLAVLAYAPGGVTVFGLKWDVAEGIMGAPADARD